jgi:hypothetical protein
VVSRGGTSHAPLSTSPGARVKFVVLVGVVEFADAPSDFGLAGGACPR